jgi:hypothetical protein
VEIHNETAEVHLLCIDLLDAVHCSDPHPQLKPFPSTDESIPVKTRSLWCPEGMSRGMFLANRYNGIEIGRMVFFGRTAQCIQWLYHVRESLKGCN